MHKEPFKPNMSKLNTQSFQKSLIDPTGEQTLQLSQPEINFVNTEINELYEISIFIRNVSPNSQKIKIKKTQASCFTITTNREGNLAAGLDMKLTVLFDSKENITRQDRIFVMTEQSELEIPVNVYPQVGKL